MRVTWFRVLTMAVTIGLLHSDLVFAATGTVTQLTDAAGNSQTGSLRQVINWINDNGTGSSVVDNSIVLPTSGTITVTLGDLPVLTKNVTIAPPSGSIVIDGGSARAFATFQASLAIGSTSGAVTIQNATATGGSSRLGGGGLGAGGGVYIDLDQTLTLTNTSITSCTAQGGSIGGSTNFTGGGGPSFSIGAKDSTNSNGAGNGGQGTITATGGSGAPATQGSLGYGGGTGGFSFGGAGGAGGGDSVGDDGFNSSAGGAGGDGGYCGGGGGGGFDANSAGGGGGGNGGGDGGNDDIPTGGGGGGGGGFAGGGGSSNTTGGGGGGGFGGGGGSGSTPASGGGGGGFGGGGGNGSSTDGGGFGGSYGGKGNNVSGSGSGGGGGGGLGGGIFVGDGATLNLGDAIDLTGNDTIGGTGGNSNGVGYADDIFLFQGAKVVFNGANNATITFLIQSDVANSYPGNPGAPAGHLDSGLEVALTNSASIITLNSINNYQGATTLTSGALSISADGNLGTAPGVVTPGYLIFDGGTLITGASFTLNSNRGISLNSNGILQPTTGTLTYNGIMAGAGTGITKSGAGILSLGGINSYTGPTSITEGILRAGVAYTIANTSALTLSNVAGAEFDLNNFNQTVGSISGGGASGGNITLGSATLTVNQTVDGVYNGAIAGTGNLNLSGASILSLGGTNTFNGATNITGTTVTFTGGAFPSDITTNGILNVTGAVSTGAINNTGTLNIAATLTSSGNIINNILLLAANINMPGFTFTNSGNTTITGTRNINATTYTNTGTQQFTITNGSNYDNLTVTGDVILDNSVINVSSSFIGSFNKPIVTGASLSHIDTIVNVPANFIYDFTPTQLLIISTTPGFALRANPGFNQKVATVLDTMATNITNSGQQTLIDAFNSYTTNEGLNSGLQQLIPNLNASAPDVMLQDYVFNRVETRIAAVTNPNSGMTGMVAGDLNPTTAMWLGGFGSIARQQAIGENPGYDSNSFGVIVGFDNLMRNNGVFGFGLAFSRNLVKEKSNVNFVTGIDGYHAVLYENYYFKCDKFLEALATAALTNSSGSRAININGTIMSTSSNYNGGQGAIRFNYGKNFDFDDVFSIAPLATIQYSLLYAPDYNETYSPAALHVSPTNYQDILTMGGGVRLSMPANEWWLLGSREFRALVTYDAISSDNLTTANFLVGSPNFAVSTSPERLALKLGVDFAFNIMRCTQVAFEYDYELRHKYTDHSGTLKIRYLF